ncbi:MAG: PaaI family thioesterase [Actinobacteria bacterium]|nr:PaaI family thioesterase [Actinomycetota bacterium]
MTPDARATRMTDLFGRAPLAAHLGMTLRFDADLRAVVGIAHAPFLDHGLGQVHGGVFATLIDTAAWFTAAVHYDTWISTVDFSVRLLEPAEGEDLVATGEIVRLGRRLAAADAEVRTAAGRLTAVGGGTFAVTGVEYG